jgi:hypothetical protein
MKETVNDYVRLTLKRALAGDAGTYCVLARNVYGVDRSFVTVRVSYVLAISLLYIYSNGNIF